MLFLINLPVKIVKLFTSNISSSEIAAGVCVGMFLGFIPLNGPMAILLFICFFVFKINRLTAILLLPVFKLFYLVGITKLADLVGGVLLINMGFLAGFWKWFISLPIVAYLDLNNTLVTGGLVVSAVLCYPVYLGSKKGVEVLRAKYFDKLKNNKFITWFKKLPIINKIVGFITRASASNL